MGLTIHYGGAFNPKASLTAMIEEVKYIADTYKWKCFVFEDTFPVDALGKPAFNQNIYGICFTP